ncbi:MAG: galactosyltransferase-related protein [Bacteroidota bacterium]
MVVKKLKSKIPAFISFPFWYVFKAPQRKVSGYTLYADIQGILIFLYRQLVPKKPLQPISICTGIYNRSDNYLNNLLASLNNATHKELIELSVFDCNTNDIENLQAAIRQQWKGKLVFNSENRAFSRSYSFNKAVAQAASPIVFICDADLSLPQNIVSLCNNYVSKKTVWFPIYFFLFKNKPVKVAKENGEWEQYGSKGMFACTKKAYEQIGGLNEQYTTWGYEDTELWLRFHQEHYTIIRNQQANFFHHWHTTHNPKYAHLN